MNKEVIKKVIVASAVFAFLIFGLPKTMEDMNNYIYKKEVNIAIEEQGLDRKAAEEYVNEDRKKRNEESSNDIWFFPVFIPN